MEPDEYSEKKFTAEASDSSSGFTEAALVTPSSG